MYIAIDIGGTNIRVAATNSLENPSFTTVEKFSLENIYTKDLAHIIEMIQHISNENKIEGIGLSIAGDIDTYTQTIEGTDYLKDWVKKPIVKDVGTNFNCKVVIQNNAATAGLGEAIYGQGKNQNFLFLIWGSGFGGTAIQHNNSEVIISPFDPGHQIIHQDGIDCVCGQKGCLQAYVGGKEIQKIYQKQAYDLTENEWNKVLDDVCQGVMNLVAIRPTQLIIFGGGVAINQEKRIEQLNTLLHRKLTIPQENIPAVKLTLLGDHTALYGALALLSIAPEHLRMYQ